MHIWLVVTMECWLVPGKCWTVWDVNRGLVTSL